MFMMVLHLFLHVISHKVFYFPGLPPEYTAGLKVRKREQSDIENSELNFEWTVAVIYCSLLCQFVCDANKSLAVFIKNVQCFRFIRL